jgi:predicted nucleic-acid-binding Zn-ribbon protein
MKLDDKQKKHLLEYIDQKWPEPKACPICKNTDWYLSDTIFEIREYFEAAFKTSGLAMPLIVLACKTCGYTILFNAISIGIIEPNKKEVRNE